MTQQIIECSTRLKEIMNTYTDLPVEFKSSILATINEWNKKTPKKKYTVEDESTYWIKRNLPSKQTVRVYYKKYKKYHVDRRRSYLDSRKFNDIMEKEGYNRKKIVKGLIWEKSEYSDTDSSTDDDKDDIDTIDEEQNDITKEDYSRLIDELTELGDQDSDDEEHICYKDDDEDIDKIEQVYCVIPQKYRHICKNGMRIIKIGRHGRADMDRVKSYGSKMICLDVTSVNNSKVVETALLKAFNNKFIPHSGNEYFWCITQDAIDLYKSIIALYPLDLSTHSDIK